MADQQQEIKHVTRRRILRGTVKSDGMDKTCIVEVTHRVLHRTYKKYVNRKARYKAHDEQNKCRVGDVVEIIESRPISRDKRWRIQKLVERPQ